MSEITEQQRKVKTALEVLNKAQLHPELRLQAQKTILDYFRGENVGPFPVNEMLNAAEALSACEAEEKRDDSYLKQSLRRDRVEAAFRYLGEDMPARFRTDAGKDAAHRTILLAIEGLLP